jgi:hypothetical protein
MKNSPHIDFIYRKYPTFKSRDNKKLYKNLPHIILFTTLAAKILFLRMKNFFPPQQVRVPLNIPPSDPKGRTKPNRQLHYIS